MRIIEEKQAVDLSEKVTIEITVGELALITETIGNSNVIEDVQMVEESNFIRSIYKEELRKIAENKFDQIYDTASDYLEAKGVFK